MSSAGRELTDSARRSGAPTSRTVTLERVIDCKSPRSPLWDALSDTDRLNQALGLAPLDVSDLDGAGAARYLMRTRISGFSLTYEELPYVWERPERFAVTRIYRAGVIERMEASWRFENHGEGTRVHFGLRLDAISRLLKPVVNVVGWFNVRRIGEIIAAVDARLGAHAAADDDAEQQRDAWRDLLGRPTIDHAALARGRAALAEQVPEAPGELLDKLVATIEHAPDDEVARMRPFELADRWQSARTATLDLFLGAVVAGLLELGWDVVCPSCRTTSTREESLGELEEHHACQLCDISFDLDLDRTVEATFSPLRTIRPHEFRPYCVGGPARMPHVLVQQIAPAGATLEIDAPSELGRYRVFARGGASATVEITDGGPERVELRADDERVEPAHVEVAPGARLLVHNDGEGGERHIKLERMSWASQAATAHAVSLRPRFRRQFAADVLRPGLGLRISAVGLLFSDLTGSTALYSTVGDAAAYALVQEHFTLLGAVIERHEGSIVKTIGDAIMASFPDEQRALSAALEMLRAFDTFCGEQQHGEHVGLKLGVFGGPCYVVRANGLLDYFGQTVNITARLQGEAASGEVVAPADLAERAAEEGWLDGARVADHFEAELKGLDEPMPAVRIVCDG